MTRLLVVTPVLPPAPGGGGVYTELLTEALLRSGLAESTVVLSEAFPDQPPFKAEMEGRRVYLRLLPYRAGRSEQDLRSYVDYALAQFALLRIISIVRTYSIDVILFHCSIFYNPGSAQLVLKILRAISDVRCILDVRDPKLPVSLFQRSLPFDRVICCSENLKASLESRINFAGKVDFIPIPLRKIIPSANEINSILQHYELRPREYIFSGNGIIKAKRSDLLIEAALELSRRGHRRPLVIAGRRRDWDARAEMASSGGYLRFLGPIDHSHVLCLAAGAAAVVNPSPIETPSRMSLEALMLGTPSLLPPHVIEFERACPELICRTDSPMTLASQIEWILSERHVPRYDISMHNPDRVAPLYGALFNNIRASNCAGRRQ